MKTDNPFKCLALLRSDELLAWLGMPADTVISAESVTLPMVVTTYLDLVMRLRTPLGQVYRHIVEFQGYLDNAILWRLVLYMAWEGRQNPDEPILGTIVYLSPEYDVGDTIAAVLDGQEQYRWTIRVIRLWEEDARAAVESGSLLMTVLSPLMHNASVATVEAAVVRIMHEAPPTQKADLLVIVGNFSEPIVPLPYFLKLVGGKEMLKDSQLFQHLLHDTLVAYDAKFAAQQTEFERERKRLQREAQQRLEQEQQEKQRLQQEAQQRLQQEAQQRLQQELAQILEDTVLLRFPNAPLALIRDIRRVQQPAALHRLTLAVQQVADVEAVQQ
ncbi:MAG: hypothetical protein HC837_04660, partial [Chloroflexaceae bacterium]|nr:hypothetical protein [Chloroflexaceae bacterium]